jgi:hypothetical protein
MGEEETLGREPVDVGGPDVAPVGAEVRVTEVVGHDQEDVRPPIRWLAASARYSLAEASRSEDGADDKQDECIAGVRTGADHKALHGASVGGSGEAIPTIHN